MRILFLIIYTIVLSACSDGSHNKHYVKYHAKEKHKSEYVANASYRKKFSDSERTFDFAGVSQPKFKSIREENIGDVPQKYESPYGDIHDIMQEGNYVGQYKVGQPYEVGDTFYYPQEYEDYEEVGFASWYGDEFHGKKTANGEIYNSFSMTAAHRTLPLPSIVRVTNLNNGKSVLLRVNDRGPFAKERVLDVSELAAHKLGFHDKGTAEVKVELLSGETENLLEMLKIKRND